jgi:signal transduction histidine kinase
VRELQDALDARRAEVERREAGLETARAQAAMGTSPSESAAADEAERNSLLSAVAQQVRDPLGIIQGLIDERLESRWLGKKDKETLEAVQSALGGLTQRLGSILDFTRPLPLERGVTQARDIVEAVAGLVSERCGKQGVKLVKDVPRGLPALSADGERLKEALLKLAVNSLESMPKGGTLRLGARWDAATGTLELEVADTGSGVAAEQLKEVGRPFFTTKPGGAGLGVAIARRVAQAHGGSFSIESRPESGSKAVLRLPAPEK